MLGVDQRSNAQGLESAHDGDAGKDGGGDGGGTEHEDVPVA